MPTSFPGLLRLAFLFPLAVFSQAGQPAIFPAASIRTATAASARTAPTASARTAPAGVEPSKPCQVCSFNVLNPFSSPTNEITGVSGTVDFYIVFFSRTTTMNTNTVYSIATISGGCLPSATRFITIVASGRTWLVEVTTSGAFNAEITSGSAVPAGTVIDLESSYSQ